MYRTFFGLTRLPFDLTPNPEYLFLTPSHREALSNLEYGISARIGVTMLIAEAGMGKTTLIRATLNSVPAQQVRLVYLNNPTLTRSEFLEFLAREFDLGRHAASSKSNLLFELERALGASRDRGVMWALIIDEAQSLPHALLEEVRLLTNIETSSEKLLPIVLAGQPELARRLSLPRWRQMKQRIGLRCNLRPLDLNETAAYIMARVQVAGGHAAMLFTREAVMLIHKYSGGIPRTISVICNNALISGFALNRRPVGTEIVREVCRDFDLEKNVASVLQTTPKENPSPGLSSSKSQGPAEGVSAQVGSLSAQHDLFEGIGRSRFSLR